MTERPSETLRRAADLIAERAAAASDAPWGVESMRDHTYGIWTTGTGFSGEDDHIASTNVEADAVWVAMLAPAVAPHLVEWLRVEADCLDGNSTITVVAAMGALLPGSEVTAVVDTSAAALAFARSVLGEGT